MSRSYAWRAEPSIAARKTRPRHREEDARGVVVGRDQADARGCDR
jgi:hypothetical protein